ncbi:MAG TPA: hypothetical protein PKE06_22125 [Flavilitoribacter sp.]|nr:hypothetical protein [Flavilitoribacter sp.]
MSVIDHLASAFDRRDEKPNLDLAAKIAESEDLKAVEELVANLQNRNKDIQSDCIKVLYEIGARKPGMIAGHIQAFLSLLESRNNRLQWGAMTALDCIAEVNPEAVYAELPRLAAAADQGSVITRDHYVGILIKLCRVEAYRDSAFALLNEQLLGCPENQLPMYAENALPVIGGDFAALFRETLTSRLDDFEKASKRARIEKVLKKLAARL